VEQQLLSSIRILIADDYEGWRRQARLLLEVRAEWLVIAEAADGSAAVRKAEELKPDLILLDIGLPKLNGIEAARRIRQLSPSSKIVFLSLNNDLDIARAALGTGAMGYVHKADARSELLPAVDAGLRGERFVSGRLKGYEFSYTSGDRPSHRHEQVTSKRATKRIFQIAYTKELLIDRVRLLKSRGYAVTSAMGNEAAKTLLPSLHGDDLDIALFIVGHAAPPQTRQDMVDWLKANYPGIKILALNPPNQKMSYVDCMVL
jgi:DNA-binding NarL/FixJ family response regulator